MSSTSEIGGQPAAASVNQPNVSRARASSWSLWTRQTLAVMSLEIKKNFLSRRAFLLYLIAGLPLVLLSMLALFPPPTDEMENFSELSTEYAAMYGGLILRTLVFFGCAWVFRMIRGEWLTEVCTTISRARPARSSSRR